MLQDGPWSQQNLDAGACKIIPVPAPLGGALVVGEAFVTYFQQQQPMRTVPMRQAVITAWGRIDEDGSRCAARV